jgi:hypothetical protein
MMNSYAPYTQEEIRRLLDYSYYSGEPGQFRHEFGERRKAFIDALPDRHNSFTSQLFTNQTNYSTLAQMLLASCFASPLTASDCDADFATRSFLGLIVQRIAAGEELSDKQLTAFHLLQKRFEVNKRIYDYYSPSVTRKGECFRDLALYALFSLVLMILFIKCRYFSYLNTALKINDLIVMSGWENSESRPVYHCLVLEKTILGELGAL